jgi:hypothetical protein
MAPFKLCKHLLEHYMIVKSTIIIAFAIGKFQFSNSNCQISMKFIGICVSMYCYGGFLSRNLVVKEYKPTPTEQKNNQAPTFSSIGYVQFLVNSILMLTTF